MVCAMRLAERLGRIKASDTQRLLTLLQALHLPMETPAFDRQQVLAIMMHDKKVQNGKLSFALPSCIGHVELVGDIEANDVEAVLDIC
jgi:3-dehydroquinate synthase